jgi:hypothetical protein
MDGLDSGRCMVAPRAISKWRPAVMSSPEYSVRFLPMGRLDVPYPQVYWMERFQEWTKLEFHLGVIQGGGHTLIVNTGLPPDASSLAQAWRAKLGDRALLDRPDDCRPEIALPRIGIDPRRVEYIVVTPIQTYATGNLRLFTGAKICLSRRGWLEDVMAPAHAHQARQRCIADDDLHWMLGENASNVVLLDDTHELLPGLICRWAGVHHRSSILVEVPTRRGLVVLSDCAFHFANVEENRPLGIAESILEAREVYADIRRRADHFIPLYEPRLQERYPGGIVA